MPHPPTDHPLKPGERILFVTGRLAEGVVRRVVSEWERTVDVVSEVQVLPISVAALMHVDWLLRKLSIENSYDRVILPGWCQGDLKKLEQHFGIPCELGPRDILDVAAFFGGRQREQVDLSRYDIDIIAEINHAPRLSECELMEQARRYRQAGADIIDIGCIPGEVSPDIGQMTHHLREEGFRVSIDSFERPEVEAAVDAGAELVLSCNSSNLDWARNLAAELVVIPDSPTDLGTMWDVADQLRDAGCRYRVDPILEPIGFGFAASLARYYEVRRRDPHIPMMMGVGNLTEMTEVDSAGINFLLAALCQELRINSVLTTEVINWCQTTVAEFDHARRMVKQAVDHHTLPKRMSSKLVMLHDPALHELGDEALQTLAQQIRDPNYRIFVERSEIHVMNRDGYWRGTDPYELFDRFTAEAPSLAPAHAFYLGYELCKAVTALTLGKQYRQDEALQWGLLTIPEISAHERRRHSGKIAEEER